MHRKRVWDHSVIAKNEESVPIPPPLFFFPFPLLFPSLLSFPLFLAWKYVSVKPCKTSHTFSLNPFFKISTSRPSSNPQFTMHKEGWESNVCAGMIKFKPNCIISYDFISFNYLIRSKDRGFGSDELSSPTTTLYSSTLK